MTMIPELRTPCAGSPAAPASRPRRSARSIRQTHCFVARRTPEIGVRMVLGARAGDVKAMIVRDGLKLVAPCFRVCCRVCSTGCKPSTYGVGALLLFLAEALAAWLPARSASGVQPLVALRADG
jgi:hypothetical protein